MSVTLFISYGRKESDAVRRAFVVCRSAARRIHRVWYNLETQTEKRVAMMRVSECLRMDRSYKRDLLARTAADVARMRDRLTDYIHRMAESLKNRINTAESRITAQSRTAFRAAGADVSQFSRIAKRYYRLDKNKYSRHGRSYAPGGLIRVGSSSEVRHAPENTDRSIQDNISKVPWSFLWNLIASISQRNLLINKYCFDRASIRKWSDNLFRSGIDNRTPSLLCSRAAA